MRKAISALWTTLSNSCPAGGSHTPGGGTGPWANRCTKCGTPC